MNTEKDIKNTLLNRREIEVLIDSDSNPGFEKALELVSNEFKSDKECVKIKAIRGHYGTNKFLIEAIIYDSKEDLEKTEPKPKQKKGGSN